MTKIITVEDSFEKSSGRYVFLGFVFGLIWLFCSSSYIYAYDFGNTNYFFYIDLCSVARTCLDGFGLNLLGVVFIFIPGIILLLWEC